MSYEDIEEARAKRAAKEVIKGKGKRGWKRKSAALEVGETAPEPEPEVEVINDRENRRRKRKSAALEADEPEPESEPKVARTIDVPVPWRAPIVKMI